MAWIEADALFNPDQLTAPIIGITSQLMRHNSGIHQHHKGQLLFAEQGSMKVIIQERLSVIPPQKIVWIPPKYPHQVFFTEVVGYRSIYIDTKIFPTLPIEPATWNCRPLLKAIVEEIAQADWQTNWQLPAREAYWLILLWQELQYAPRADHYLMLPQDYRLQHYNFLESAPPLAELSQKVAASERTITRIFLKETGLHYQAWRQQWRLFRAIELLNSSKSILDIALILGFSNDSAFSTFFKNMTGDSPRSFLKNKQTENQKHR